MNFNDVIKAFVQHKIAYSQNIHSTGTALFSYDTCIAEYANDLFVVNMTAYSNTTTKHRNALLKLIKGKYTILYVYNIPKETQRLWTR